MILLHIFDADIDEIYNYYLSFLCYPNNVSRDSTFSTFEGLREVLGYIQAQIKPEGGSDSNLRQCSIIFTHTNTSLHPSCFHYSITSRHQPYNIRQGLIV